MARIFDDITQTIGNTPLVRVDQIMDGAGAKVLAKLDELGLVLDSDPRKATQTGAAKIYQEGEENGPNSDGS